MHIGNQVPHPFRTQLAARMRLTEVAGHGHLPGYRRRLRPEDRALPRGAHGRGAGARIAAPGALARGPRREPDRGEPRARGRGANPRGGRREGADSRARARDRRGFRRLLLLSGELSGARGRDDPDRPLSRFRTTPTTSRSRSPTNAATARCARRWRSRAGSWKAPSRRSRASWRSIRSRCGASTCCGPADLPYPMLTGLLLEDVTPREALERALEAFDLAGVPRAAGGRSRPRHLSRRRPVLRRRIHHLRLGLLQGRRHSRLRP